VPASSEKAISEATACKEELEKQKVKQEKKLEEVMESLKEETSGLQQDKEVRVFVLVVSRMLRLNFETETLCHLDSPLSASSRPKRRS